MPINDVATPTPMAPIDRMSLGVGWVRPIATSMGVTVNPTQFWQGKAWEGKANCFEGSGE